MAETGARIGPYEVVSLLGRGGMGEVYRARDTRLQRDVALKLLPTSVAADPDRLARFTREAQLLAALNHPNVASIYGVEEGPEGAALVLELVEGPTLAERLAAGPLALDDAIAIARQIAEALEAAHEQGVVHRDLKPSNIKLRPDGTVKVLDFGLAKAMASPATSGAGTADIAASPTLTAHATAAGLILGTAAYMAPEQARGRAVDRRADIWAFGLVLFEMLSGTRPFGGETISETLASIIKDTPAWNALPAGIPVALQALLRRMLEKDPKRRLRDIGDARLVLEDLEAGEDALAPTAPRVHSRWRTIVPWTIAAAAVAAAAVLAVRPFKEPAPETPLLKFSLPVGAEGFDRTRLPVISPDGRHLAYVKDGTMWVRPLDQLGSRPLGGTEGAQYLMWSPDSDGIAYLTANALFRVGLDGSAPVRIASYRFSLGGRTPGGVWRRDGTIIFAPAATGSGLLSVSAQGGEFTEFYARDPKTEGDFHRPALLPDGRTVLFVVDRGEKGPDTIGLLADGKRKDLLTIEGEAFDSVVYSPTGHLLYNRETMAPGLWASPFSLERAEVTGTPFLVASQGSYPSMSTAGTLIYMENSVSGLSTLAWLDVESGKVTPAFTEELPAMTQPHLSPDGTHVAVVVRSQDAGYGVVIGDLQRQTHVRLADGATRGTRPVWRDDRTVIYQRNDPGSVTLVMRRADGSGAEIPLGQGQMPSVRNDRLLFSRINAGTSGDLYQLILPPGDTAPGPPQLVQQLPAAEWDPMLSPDGRLLAYTRGEAGQTEVILRTFPDASGQWQVSSNGGNMPVWSRRGDTIYYRDIPGQIMRVDVRRTPTVTLSAPRIVRRPLTLIARAGFDVSPDGKRLLMVSESATGQPTGASIAVVQNWFAAFRK